MANKGIDITKYDGAIEEINDLLTANRQVELRMEDEGLAIAEHKRVFSGVYREKGERK